MKKLSDREKIETIFKHNEKAECDFLLYMAGVIYRSRFSETAPAKRAYVRKPPKVEDHAG